MTTTIFNPAQFAPPDQPSEAQSSAPTEQKSYAVTGNSTRDSVRKLLFEIFTADDSDTRRIATLIEALETQISKDCPDPKSRQYRDSSRALQLKLKGQRFTDLRMSLLKGDMTVQEVCSQEFLNGKATLSAKPSTGPRSGAPGSTPMGRPGMIPGRGAPGQAVKPRGMPGMIRPPGPGPMKPKMPVKTLAPASSSPELPRVPAISTDINDAPTTSLQIEEPTGGSQSARHSQDQPSPARSRRDSARSVNQQQPAFTAPVQVQPQQVRYQPDFSEPPQQEAPVMPIQEEVSQPSNQQTFNEPVTQAAAPIEEPSQPPVDETIFNSFQNSQLDISQQNMTKDSVDMSMSYEQPSQDQIGGALPPVNAPKKKKKGTKKKKIKDKSPRQVVPQAEPIVEEQHAVVEQQPKPRQQEVVQDVIVTPPRQQEIIPEVIEEPVAPIQKPEQQVSQEVQEIVPPIRVEEETKEEVRPQISVPQSPTPSSHPVQLEQPPQQNLAMPQQSIRAPAPILPSPSHQRRAQAEEQAQKTFDQTSDTKLDQLLNENQRLRAQLRQQNQYEDTLLSQEHQIQLLQAQLKGRDDQMLQLRWQMQQAQAQHQREVDELRQRIKRQHLESQNFRELINQQRVSPPAAHPQAQTSQLAQSEQPPQFRPQQNAVVPISRNDEMTADRGSNFLSSVSRNFNQHGGNEANSQELLEANLESGEADEGGRDDGHFYRQTTADEGTGGAGESYQQQQRIIDVSASGSGQMPQTVAGQYQRFEQAYGIQSEGVQQINEDEYDEEETYQAQQHNFSQPELIVPSGFPQPQTRPPTATQPQVSNTRVKESSSGSAFGEGNQQDDSEEEGMGMGMGNRQGSGHDVEDESGSLDVVAQNSGQLPQQNPYGFKFGHKGPEDQSPKQQLLNANNQSEGQEPQQHVQITELEDDQEGEQHSLEEGGCRSNGGDEQLQDHEQQHTALNVVPQDVVDEFDMQPSRRQSGTLPTQQQVSCGQVDSSREHSGMGDDHEEDMMDGQSQQHFNQNAVQQNAQFFYDQMAEEEEKEETASGYIAGGNSGTLSTSHQQRLQNAQVISDNVERPQPYHPRQQQRATNLPGQSATQQVAVSSGNAAVQSTPGSLVYPQQNTFMQGESISQNVYQQDRSAGVPQIMKQSMGGVAVVSRSTRDQQQQPQIPPKNAPIATDSQVGERPGAPGQQPQQNRRGNKQQFQVPPLPPVSSSQLGSGKGQGQGGGVVGQNQSSSQTRNGGRNSRGTQRNNLQQQVFATTPNTSTNATGGANTQSTAAPGGNNGSVTETSPPRILQVLRPPASQASSAAQLPISQQNAQVSAGGATGGVQHSFQRQQTPSSPAQDFDQTQAHSNSQQYFTNYGNSQPSTQTPSGVCLQASTMPASQASVSGSQTTQQRQQLQQHNGGGPQDSRYPTTTSSQVQSAPAISQHGARLEGVVHTPTAQQQQTQMTSQAQQQFSAQAAQQQPSTASNTQALGGAMMGSSGSALIIGGDMGGLTDRNQRQGSNQMNAESGSTTEFTAQQQRQPQNSSYPPSLGSGGSNAMQTSSQAYQQVSSPPSTSNPHVRTGSAQYPHAQPQAQQFQSSQQSNQHQQNTEQEGASASGGGEADFFVASVGATPLAMNARGAISQAHPPAPQSSSQQTSQQVFSGNRQQNSQQPQFAQQQAFYQPQQQMPAQRQGGQLSSSGEPADHLPNQNASSGGAAAGGTSNQGESGANMVGQQHQRYQQQQLQQQSHTDSRKTSGANTPSKDGADTPPYRDQMQNNSYILNLTSKRLLGLQHNQQQQQQRGLLPPTANIPTTAMAQQQPQQIAEQQDEDVFGQQQTSSSGPSQQRSQHSSSAEGHKVIPRNMFE